jgi:protein phosphatase
MPEWLWIALGVLLIFALVYALSRGAEPSPALEPQAGPAPEPAPSPAAPKVAIPPVEVSATSNPPPGPTAAGSAAAKVLPKMEYEEDEDVDPTKVGAANAPLAGPPPTKKILYDDDAAADEPTHSGALILVTATGQTDRGLRRKRNEDSLLALVDEGVYVVADGMGGYKGGEIASAMAVKTIERAFREKYFEGPPHDSIPKRASELARAIHSANTAILARAGEDKELAGMGTTIVAARFSPNKQRLYIGHVGDSRMYRLRGGVLKQMTSDHTMKDLGVTGAGSAHLSRALGVWPTVPIDIILGKPQPDDLYLLCSDGLTKMVSDESIKTILESNPAPNVVVEKLIEEANTRGGKDNITVIVIRCRHPLGKA